MRSFIVVAVIMLSLTACQSHRASIVPKTGSQYARSRANSALAATPTAPPSHILTYAYVQDGYVAAAHANQWLTFCEGGTADTVRDCTWTPENPTGAKPIMYWSANIAQPDTTGNDVDMPFKYGESNYNGTCPEPTSHLFRSSVPQEEWFMHSANAPTPTYSYRIGAIDSKNHLYNWFMALNDASLQNYAAGVAARCQTKDGTTSLIWSRFYGIFEDNMTYVEQVGESPWGGDYNNVADTNQKNVGVYTGSGGFASTNCPGDGMGATFYNGSATLCTRSSQLDGTDLFTFEYPDEIYFDQSFSDFSSKILHNSVDQQQGPQFAWFLNGMFSTWNQWLCCNDGAVGAVTETQVIQRGAVQPAKNIANVIDICTSMAQNFPSYYWVYLDTAPGPATGAAELGTQLHQQMQRVHFAVAWICMYPNLVDWPNLEYANNKNAAGQSLEASVWDLDFINPTGAYQTAAKPTPDGCGLYGTFNGSTGAIPELCTAGGANETQASGGYCASGNPPNCIYVREFSDCWWQKPDFSAGQVDEGPCAVALNLTGSSKTVSSGWFPHWSSLNHVMLPCTPSQYISNGTYSGENTSTVVCSGSSGGDAGAGGTLDWSTSKAALTTLPNDDAVLLTGQ